MRSCSDESCVLELKFCNFWLHAEQGKRGLAFVAEGRVLESLQVDIFDFWMLWSFLGGQRMVA